MTRFRARHPEVRPKGASKDATDLSGQDAVERPWLFDQMVTRVLQPGDGDNGDGRRYRSRAGAISSAQFRADLQFSAQLARAGQCQPRIQDADGLLADVGR